MNLEITCLARLLFAGALGGLIGLEREFRSKEAGLRTHFLVAIGSTLFMLISQYGFTGALQALTSQYGPEISFRLDISRVAAQVVAGIGFIGAGMIVLHRRFVVGLTTAAGIWTTAAIGLAVGCGMYISAIAATVLVLIGLELFMHISDSIRHQKREMNVVFLADNVAARDAVLDAFNGQGKSVVAYSSEHSGGKVRVNVDLEVPEKDAKAGKLLEFLKTIDGIETESIR